MRQPKKPRVIKHCPHHGDTELKRRKGRQTRKWLWECPQEDCNYKSYEERNVQTAN